MIYTYDLDAVSTEPLIHKEDMASWDDEPVISSATCVVSPLRLERIDSSRYSPSSYFIASLLKIQRIRYI